MRVCGIDFTSRPTRRKPITCAVCSFERARLVLEEVEEWQSFEPLERFLSSPGPWIAGLDFPFGQARRFVENIGWPRTWAGYVTHTAGMSRREFRAALDSYRAPRPAGDKEHRRAVDVAAGSISPQKLYGVPVGLMFFEGAPRLLAANVTIPLVRDGDPDRIAVEAYPGVMARRVIGRRSYKHDTASKQSLDQAEARREILHALRHSMADHGFEVEAPDSLADDPSGDQLDALLCAVQAAWSFSEGPPRYGAPASVDPLEGWIADPAITDR